MFANGQVHIRIQTCGINNDIQLYFIMNIWFECKVVYRKDDENGKSTRATEVYLVEALNFSEAEERISREVAPFGEFTVASIKKSPINEIFPNEEGDKWYKFKVAFVTIDEVSAKEHRANSNILVIGNDLMNAADHLIENMKDSVSDYEIVSITETSILDIFPYTMDDNSDADLTHLPNED